LTKCPLDKMTTQKMSNYKTITHQNAQLTKLPNTKNKNLGLSSIPYLFSFKQFEPKEALLKGKGKGSVRLTPLHKLIHFLY
jgi:hypothetical protein